MSKSNRLQENLLRDEYNRGFQEAVNQEWDADEAFEDGWKAAERLWMFDLILGVAFGIGFVIVARLLGWL